MKRIFIITTGILTAYFGLLSCELNKKVVEPQQPITTVQELTDALIKVYQNSSVPGFSIAVVNQNQVVYQQAFGHANISNGSPYSVNTIQPIGSISKTFIGAAVVKAIEQGLFTLETDINEILPFDISSPDYPENTIRVKHLVTHTSGLEDNLTAYYDAYYIINGENLESKGAQILQTGLGFQQRSPIPLAEFLSKYYQSNTTLFSGNPGDNWAYSNIASSLAAYLVEAASGVPFSQYVKKNILNPLAMDNTSYNIVGSDQQRLATLYWNKNTSFPKYGNDSYPDGGLYTSNRDLTNYLLDMMKGVQGNSSTLFSTAGYETLFSPLLADGIVPEGLANNQGMFWFIHDDYIGQTGSDPGTTCTMQIDKNGGNGYFILTNSDASTDQHQTNYNNFSASVHTAVSQFLQNQ